MGSRGLSSTRTTAMVVPPKTVQLCTNDALRRNRVQRLHADSADQFPKGYPSVFRHEDVLNIYSITRQSKLFGFAKLRLFVNFTSSFFSSTTANPTCP